MQKRRFQKYGLCLILGVMTLLASCAYFEPDVANEFDFSTAIMQWEIDDDPEEMVEDNGFEDLTYSRAKLASQLGAEGTMVGRYVGETLSEREIIGFLLNNYIVDANQHIVATVYLMSEGRDETGYWASLVSEDPYWTNESNLDIYAFVIRIQDDGEVWLHNAELGE